MDRECVKERSFFCVKYVGLSQTKNLGIDPSTTTRAFVGTDATDEPILQTSFLVTSVKEKLHRAFTLRTKSTYTIFGYSAFAALYTGSSGSAYFHRLRKYL